MDKKSSCPHHTFCGPTAVANLPALFFLRYCELNLGNLYPTKNNIPVQILHNIWIKASTILPTQTNLQL